MRLVRLLAAALLTMAALETTVSVAQLPPTRFYGTVVLNGEVPPVDTVIEAYVGDVFCGEGTVQDVGDPIGVGYFIDVFADAFKPGCGTDGTIVSFRVGGVPAAVTGEFQTGGFVQVDLVADGAPAPPPVAIPSADPGTEPPSDELPVPPPSEPQPEPAPEEPQPEPGPEPEPTPEPGPEPEPEPAPEEAPEG